jgi:hypothetical protein
MRERIQDPSVRTNTPHFVDGPDMGNVTIEETEDGEEVVRFDEDNVKEYLDNCIDYWRREREIARSNVDTFQSIRVSLFGEQR